MAAQPKLIFDYPFTLKTENGKFVARVKQEPLHVETGSLDDMDIQKYAYLEVGRSLAYNQTLYIHYTDVKWVQKKLLKKTWFKNRILDRYPLV